MPGQPESGSRWWSSGNFEYTYQFNGKVVTSCYPGLKLTNCLINLKSRQAVKGVDNYGIDYVEIGIPFMVVANLAEALATNTTHNCVLGGVKLSAADGCYWINSNIGPKPGQPGPCIEMLVSPDDDEEGTKMKQDFNQEFDSCRAVVEAEEVSNYYHCNLVVELYGSTVLAEGLTPSEVAGFEMHIKMKVRVVQLIEQADGVVGSVPSATSADYKTTRNKGFK